MYTYLPRADLHGKLPSPIPLLVKQEKRQETARAKDPSVHGEKDAQ